MVVRLSGNYRFVYFLLESKVLYLKTCVYLQIVSFQHKLCIFSNRHKVSDLVSFILT